MRVIDFLTDAATKPVMLADATTRSGDELPTDNVLPLPDDASAQR